MIRDLNLLEDPRYGWDEEEANEHACMPNLYDDDDPRDEYDCEYKLWGGREND